MDYLNSQIRKVSLALARPADEPKEEETSAAGKKSSSPDAIIPKAIETIESIKPIGRHPANMRHVTAKIIGEQHTLLTMMAHPERFGVPGGLGRKPYEGIGADDTFKKLQATGTYYLVALEAAGFEPISSLWKSVGKNNGVDAKARLFSIEDLEAPPLQLITEVFKFAQEAAQDQSGIAIYCGQGFGRTGTIAASIIMIATQKEKSASKEQVLRDFYGMRQTVPGKVADTVLALRKFDPPEHRLRSYNQRSSLHGTTVETASQYKVLVDLHNSF